MAPTLGLLGLGLHVALDHHHPDEHRPDIAQLAHVMVHGHHHEAGDSSDHEHEAAIDRMVTSSKRDPMQGVTTVTLPAPPIAHTDCPRPDPRSRLGPPSPLFTTHCSLLI